MTEALPTSRAWREGSAVGSNRGGGPCDVCECGARTGHGEGTYVYPIPTTARLTATPHRQAVQRQVATDMWRMCGVLCDVTGRDAAFAKQRHADTTANSTRSKMSGGDTRISRKSARRTVADIRKLRAPHRMAYHVLTYVARLRASVPLCGSTAR